MSRRLRFGQGRCALGTALVGCVIAGRRPVAATVVRDLQAANGFILIKIELPDVPAGRKPVVISPLGDHEPLLAAGAVVVTYDVQWKLLQALVALPAPEPPKNTVGRWLLASPSPKTIGQAYFGLLTYDSNEGISRVIDQLVQLDDIDPHRIGIAGSSTGGFKALQATVRDSRIAVAAIGVACGEYHEFLHRSSLAMNGEPLDLDPKYDKWLTEQEPIRTPDRVTHAALLMLNGDQDEAIPPTCVAETVRRFRAAYARAGHLERFRAVMYPGIGHNLDERRDLEVMAWWYRWLLRPGLGLPPG